MQITKSILVKYPTVPYGGGDIFSSVTLTDDDLPEQYRNLPLEQRAEALDGYARYLVQKEWLLLRDEVEAQLAPKWASIVSPKTEQAWLAQGINLNRK